jgi:hypothetical protein
MLSPAIGWILIISGIITAGGGFAALLSPHLLLQRGFGVDSPDGASIFFVRHWGVLIIAVAGLLVFSAYAPAFRVPVLVVAAAEKFAFGFFAFFGPLKRTSGMTAIAITDGVFAILYLAYLVGGA